MDQVRYILGVLLVIALPPGLAMWFVVHPFVGFWRRVGVVPTLVLMYALMIVGTVALFTVRDTLLIADLGTRLWTVIPGVVLFTATVALALWRRKYLTTSILTGVPELQADGNGGELLTQGPYAIMRHPRYLEMALGIFAYAFIANYLGAYLLALFTLPILHLVVLLEERELADRFGEEYAEYRVRVPRYVPRPQG